MLALGEVGKAIANEIELFCFHQCSGTADFN
jgi:hypothetical protein